MLFSTQSRYISFNLSLIFYFMFFQANFCLFHFHHIIKCQIYVIFYILDFDCISIDFAPYALSLFLTILTYVR